ncbi:MAG: winged helix-turn-helix domain-containing protein, partial [Anaerolineaceae bacterium]
IIFTDIPEYNTTREAMRPDVNGVAAAIDYISKKEGPEAMIRAIEKALAALPARNRQICFRWSHHQSLTFSLLAQWLDPSCPVKEIVNRQEELEDLFRTLFTTSDQVTFGRVLWFKSHTLAIEAAALNGNQETPCIVICGLHKDAPLAPPLGSPIARTATCHFSASVWRPENIGASPFQPLGDTFRERPERSLRQSLETLFAEFTFPPVENPADSLRSGYGKVYPLPPDEDLIAHAAKTIHSARRYHLAEMSLSAEGLRIQFPGARVWVFPHPFSKRADFFEGLSCPWISFAGGLDISTLLVGSSDTPWISENSGSGVFPAQHLFAVLENNLRAHAFETVNLPTLLDAERYLFSLKRLDDHRSMDDIEPEYRKTISLIQTIRRLASKAAEEDPLPYLLVLYHLNLQSWLEPLPNGEWTRAETASQIHHLVTASLLVEAMYRLTQTEKPAHIPTAPANTRSPLRIDPINHTAFKGEEEIHLSTTEFDLLAYLFQRRGELCTRQDIKVNVFHLSPQDKDKGGLINTNIGRLRKKIDGDANDLPYLTTVRGLGYRLEKERF